MQESQEKILGQKVNVKFFTVDPYSGGTGVPQTFLELGKIQIFFLKIKTSTIKSETNIYQTIHSTSVIFIFFGILLFFCIFQFLRFFFIFWKFYNFFGGIFLGGIFQKLFDFLDLFRLVSTCLNVFGLVLTCSSVPGKEG